MCLAVPGQILEVTGDGPLERSGRVRFGGVVREVNLVCVPEAGPGDFVMVHVGVAISRVDEGEARRVFAYLEEIESIERAGAAQGGPPARAGLKDGTMSPAQAGKKT